MRVSRRLFVLSSVLAASLVGWGAWLRGPAAQVSDVSDETSGTHALRSALERRRSTRLFAEASLEEDQLLRVLWGANGVNRPGIDGRTAPSWHGAKDVEIYVAQASSVGLYDPASNTLKRVLDEDIRKRTSPEPFVGAAPAVLIYVSDQQRIINSARDTEAGQPPESFEAEHRLAGFVDTAVIAQNVYLVCAAEGLGTCLVGGADPAAIAEALQLPPTQLVTYVQPLGHPRA